MPVVIASRTEAVQFRWRRRAHSGRVAAASEHLKVKRKLETHPPTQTLTTLLSEQCDEGHPTCRNCQKSKRACLGYDPIFKQQSAPPPSIQPAPVSNTPTVKGSPTASVIPPPTRTHLTMEVATAMATNFLITLRPWMARSPTMLPSIQYYQSKTRR